MKKVTTKSLTPGVYNAKIESVKVLVFGATSAVRSSTQVRMRVVITKGRFKGKELIYQVEV